MRWFQDRGGRLLVLAFIVVSIAGSWSSEKASWLILQALIGLTLVAELVWPSGPDRSRTIRGLSGALVVATLLIPVALWQRPPMSRKQSGPKLLATALSIEPAHAGLGQVLDLTISGSSASFAETSAPDFGPGLTILSVHRVSPTSLQARVRISDQTATGFRRVWVNTPASPTVIDNSANGAFRIDRMQTTPAP